MGNIRGTGNCDRSRCCLRQFNGSRSHTHAGAYGHTDAQSYAHAGAYGHTDAQSYAHARAYRYTGAQSTERIRRGGAYRNPGGQPASGCR